MDHSSINFRLVRDPVTQQINGFILEATEEEARRFCTSFPVASRDGQADINLLNEGKIQFVHQGNQLPESGDATRPYLHSGGGIYETEIDPADATQLDELMRCAGAYADKEIDIEVSVSRGGFILMAVTPD